MGEELHAEIDRLNREIERLKLENAAYQDERNEARRKLGEFEASFETLKRKLLAEEKGHEIEVKVLVGQKGKLQESVGRLSEKMLVAAGAVMTAVTAFRKYAVHLKPCDADPCGCGFVEMKAKLDEALLAVWK